MTCLEECVYMGLLASGNALTAYATRGANIPAESVALLWLSGVCVSGVGFGLDDGPSEEGG